MNRGVHAVSEKNEDLKSQNYVQQLLPTLQSSSQQEWEAASYGAAVIHSEPILISEMTLTHKQVTNNNLYKNKSKIYIDEGYQKYDANAKGADI